MRRWSNRGGRTSVLAIPMRCSFRPGSPCFHTLDHRPLSPFCPLFLLSCSRLRWSIPLPFPLLCCGSLHTPAHLFATLVQGAFQSSLSSAVLDVLPACLYRAGHLVFPGPGLDTFIFHSISILTPVFPHSLSLCISLSRFQHCISDLLSSFATASICICTTPTCCNTTS